jgi:tetratricopeptide (TPR) repeat protein
LKSGLSRSTRTVFLRFVSIVVLLPASVSPAISRQQDNQDEKPPAQAAQSLHYVNQGPAKCTEIGNFYFKRKNYRAALSRYQEAADTDPHYAPAYLGMGKAYEKMGLNQKALESYRKYLDMLPSDQDAENAKDVQRAIARLTGGGGRAR